MEALIDGLFREGLVLHLTSLLIAQCVSKKMTSLTNEANIEFHVVRKLKGSYELRECEVNVIYGMKASN